MNNHERAKRIEEYLWRCHNTTPSYKAIAEALDATEESAAQTQPKPRPAFLGDEVFDTVSDLGAIVVGVHYETVYLHSGEMRSISQLRRNSYPVSRIIEHRRPIPVSERRPTREDADKDGKVLVWRKSGTCLLVPWDVPGFDPRKSDFSSDPFVAWLPCLEFEGVE